MSASGERAHLPVGYPGKVPRFPVGDLWKIPVRFVVSGRAEIRPEACPHGLRGWSPLSINLFSFQEERMFRQTTGRIACVNNILGNTGTIGKVDGRSNDMVK